MVRMTSRSPCLMTVETSMRRWSLALAMVRGGMRRAAFAASPAISSLSDARLAISGGVASCSRPSSAAESATPIRIVEVTPVRNVPVSQRAETSRLSGGPLRPSPDSGGSSPSAAIVSSLSCIPHCGSNCKIRARFPRAAERFACHGGSSQRMRPVRASVPERSRGRPGRRSLSGVNPRRERYGAIGAPIWLAREHAHV